MNDPLTNVNLQVLKNLDVWSTYSKCKNLKNVVKLLLSFMFIWFIIISINELILFSGGIKR